MTLTLPALLRRETAQLVAVAQAEQARRVASLDKAAWAERDPVKARTLAARRDDAHYAWAEIAHFIALGIPPEFVEPACRIAAETATQAARAIDGIPVRDPALPQLFGLTVIGRLMAEAFPAQALTPPATYQRARAHRARFNPAMDCLRGEYVKAPAAPSVEPAIAPTESQLAFCMTNPDLLALADRISRGEIKALSIKQPYPHHIFHDGKDVENRDWPTKGRGWFIVHAGVSKSECARSQHDLPRGGVVGIARIVDCVTEMDSDWFFGRYGFVLRDATPLPLIPCRGQLGFFQLDAATNEAIASALRAHATQKGTDNEQ